MKVKTGLLRVAGAALVIACLIDMSSTGASAVTASSKAIERTSVIAGLKDVTVEPVRIVRGKRFDWDHEIQVALPASYARTNRPYPVLWLLDGSTYFELAVKTVNYDLRTHVPEMIVAAVSPQWDRLSDFEYRRNFEFSTSSGWAFTGHGADPLSRQLTATSKRRADAGEPSFRWGGAPVFLEFLVDELRSTLSRDYRMASDHVLFGDSGGGFFCAYALISRPESFTKYICGSPHLYSGDFVLFRMEEQYAKVHADMQATVFLGAGEAEIVQENIPAWGVVSSTARMAEILSLRRYPSMKLHARMFPGEDHASVVPLNLSWGLRAVWKDHGQP